MHKKFLETLRVDWVVANAEGTKVAGEMWTEFLCIAEEGAEFGKGGQFYKKGEKRTQMSFVHYDTDENGKFLKIRIARA